MTNNCNLILFGAYNLMSGRIYLRQPDGERAAYFDVKRMPNARESGSVVINNRLTEKVITLTGDIEATGDNTLFDELAVFHKVFSDTDRFLKISRVWQTVFELGDATNWTASDDATNITEDSNEYQKSGSAISFDADVSLSGNHKVVISNTSLTPCDLSEHDETGNFEMWVYLPDPYLVNGVLFKVGNDSSNYWETPYLTAQYDGRQLEYGWNYVTCPWSDMTETGTVDPSTLDYMLIDISYESSQADITGFKVDDLIWQDDNQTVNYLCRPEGLRASDNYYEQTITKYTVNLIAHKGYGEGTNTLIASSETTIDTLQHTTLIDLEGSSEPLPILEYTINSAVNTNSLVLENVTTGTSIEASEAIADDDVIILNLSTKQLLKNGVPIPYDGSLPVFIPARNRLVTNLSTASAYDVEQLVQNVWGTSSPDRYYAQQFSTNGTANPILTAIQAFMKFNSSDLSGSNPNVHPVFIYTDSANEPNSLVANVGQISVERTNTGGAWVTLNCSVPLAASTKYWLVIKNYIGAPSRREWSDWGLASSDLYASHLSAFSDDFSIWTTSNNDMAFSVTITPSATPDYDLSITYKKLYL